MRVATLCLVWLVASCTAGSTGPRSAHAPDCHGRDGDVASAESCGSICRAELPVSLADRTPLVTVWIDGKPVQVVLDIGAGRTVLDQRAARTLNLPFDAAHPAHLVGFGGAQSAPTTRLDSLAFGFVRLTNVLVPVVTFSRFEGFTPPAGLLGNDVFRGFDLELDLPHAAVRLYQGQPCPGLPVGWSSEDAAIPWANWPDDGHVFVTAALDHKPVIAMLDTGSNGTVVDPRLARAVGVPANELSTDLATGLAGIGPDRVAGNLHRFGTLDVGGQHIEAVEAIVAPIPFPTPIMALGFDYLQVHKVWLSRATHQIHFAHTW